MSQPTRLALRPMLQSLPPYVAGRTVPGSVKLASNESPYPPLPHVLERIAAVAAESNRYPDIGAGPLTEALADRLAVTPDRVRVGAGSVALCTQLVQAVADADDEVLFAWRSFEAYPFITAISGAAAVQVPLTDHVHDLDAMIERITGKTRLILVCNPNNPTSTAVGSAALMRFLHDVPSHVVVALDEAYGEFVDDPDVPDGLSLLDEFPNLVVLRTFSKAYGLAGLRVGYAVAADPALAAALAQTQIPFSISTVAQAAALASLEEPAQEQMRQRVGEVVAERVRVRDELLELGYEVPPPQGNFVWLPLGEQTLDWARRCEEHKVVVRAFAGSGARITIGAPAENDTLLAAAAQAGAGSPAAARTAAATAVGTAGSKTDGTM